MQYLVIVEVAESIEDLECITDDNLFRERSVSIQKIRHRSTLKKIY